MQFHSGDEIKAELRKDQAGAGFDDPIEFDEPRRLPNGGVCLRASHRQFSGGDILVTLTPSKFDDCKWDVETWQVRYGFSKDEAGKPLWEMPQLASTYHGESYHRESLKDAIEFAKDIARSCLEQRSS